jgi:C_GCAxxG_C_C family probable redox protein
MAIGLKDTEKQTEKGSLSAGEVISKKHSKIAMELFKKGYNCSQSVFLAFCDECDLDFETASRLSSSFGAGMGRLREVCGAVTGMFMVAGVLYGYADPEDQAAKTSHYQRIQTLANQFEEMNHSIICRDLLGLGEGKDNPVPEMRTQKYYQNRPCEALVGMAAEMMEKYIELKKL